MAICATSARPTPPAANCEVRILRWTFHRDGETVVCELGLNSDDTAYELRLNPQRNPALATAERFDDARSAFQRHAAIEQTLVDDGWLLEGFEPERIARPR